ncbi:LysR family transcriptional regulator [Arthrobacter cavernae]|uniref:LysR family transcriptional regulator n=1 Tax=Arthrobacter cavernae TaxID=2817681 RepID=A0A939KJ09_9MICC|nr:LysR family transcriptional regulator [Arthrobacter cavernae]MBO1268167.1 LysR family transcriptional regulator [Arthrobacter cavernae]
MGEFTLRQLEYFVAVLEHGSLTEAAKQSNISQAGASMAIAQLEKSLGMDLLIRTRSKKVAPTAAGQELGTRARRILAEAAELPAALNDGRDQMRGRVAIGCMTAISPRIIPQLLGRISRRWPDIRLEFVEGPAEELQHAVADGTLDLALVYSLQAVADVDLLVLTESRPHFMLAATHPLAARDSLRFADLAQEDVILLDVPPSAERVISMFRAAGVEPRVRWRSVVAETIRGIVASGQACSVTHVWPGMVPNYLGANIRLVPITDETPPNRLVAAVAPGVRRPRRVEEVIATAKDLASAAGPGDG